MRYELELIRNDGIIKFLNKLFRTKYRRVSVAGVEYLMYEKVEGEQDLSERIICLRSKEQADICLRIQPVSTFHETLETKLERPTTEPGYVLKATLAEEIPPMGQDIGDHTYMIVDGIRFRLDEQKTYSEIDFDSIQNFIQKRIRQFMKANDRPPRELTYSCFDRTIEANEYTLRFSSTYTISEEGVEDKAVRQTGEIIR